MDARLTRYGSLPVVSVLLLSAVSPWARAEDAPPPPPITTAPAEAPPAEPATAPPPPLEGSIAPAPAPESAPAAPPSEEAHAPETPAQPTASETPAPAATEVVAQPPAAAPSVDTTATSKPDEQKRAENIVTAKREGHVPYYQTTRPAWGIELTGTIKAFGGNDINAVQAGNLMRGFEIQGEWQPPFLQSIGVISIGPEVAVYPVTPLSTATSNAFSIWSAGGQVRYQARFFREQLIVPMVGYEGQYLTYHFNDGTVGSTVASGPVFGAMLLLNIFEPSSAAEIYLSDRISRSYLVAELKNLTGNDSNVRLSGQSFFFGLRFEF